MTDEFKLSPSTINLFIDCPRCFYLQVKRKLGRPRGIFPSLPGGIDRVLKTYSDGFREKGELPPNLEGKIPGKLAKTMPRQLKYYDEEIGAILRGNLDELIEMDDGTYAALDFKTRGVPPKEMIFAYQNQLDIYTLLLEKNNYKTNNLAYLAYFYPIDVKNNKFDFEMELKEIKTNFNNARKRFSDAVEVLKADKIPDANPKCVYCAFEAQRKGLL